MLIYPAIVFWGKELDPSFRSPQNTNIPTYVTIAADDQHCAKGTIAYVEKMKSVEAPIEFHLYPKGGHGGGMKNFAWPESCEKWLRSELNGP